MKDESYRNRTYASTCKRLWLILKHSNTQEKMNFGLLYVGFLNQLILTVNNLTVKELHRYF